MTTRNIVPQNDNEGELGIQGKVWAKAHIKEINSENVNTTTVQTTNVEATEVNTTTLNTDTVETTNMLFNNMEIDFYFLKRKTVYKVDDIAYNKNTKNGVRLECVAAGTTASKEPANYSTATIGTYITDGTTKWIVCDIRDGLPYGDISYRPILKKGYVKLNGATVKRSDYPRLVKYATDNNLWTSSPTTEVWKFGNGDGSTTFVLPDYRNRFIEGGDTPAKVEAGLPNITGTTSTNIGNGRGAMCMEGTGAFTPRSQTGSAILQDSAYTYNQQTIGVDFNASRSSGIYGKSSTVQPPAITLIPQIKY